MCKSRKQAKTIATSESEHKKQVNKRKKNERSLEKTVVKRSTRIKQEKKYDLKSDECYLENWDWLKLARRETITNRRFKRLKK